MSKIVDDRAFADAWADVNYRRIMLAAASPYSSGMSRDEKDQHMRLSLYLAMREHRKDGGKSFNSMLFRATLWTFQNAVRDERRASRRVGITGVDLDPPAYQESEELRELRERLAELPDPDRRLLSERFYGKFTLVELSQLYGCGIGKIRSSLNSAMDLLRAKYGVLVD